MQVVLLQQACNKLGHKADLTKKLHITAINIQLAFDIQHSQKLNSIHKHKTTVQMTCIDCAASSTMWEETTVASWLAAFSAPPAFVLTQIGQPILASLHWHSLYCHSQQAVAKRTSCRSLTSHGGLLLGVVIVACGELTACSPGCLPCAACNSLAAALSVLDKFRSCC